MASKDSSIISVRYIGKADQIGYGINVWETIGKTRDTINVKEAGRPEVYWVWYNGCNWSVPSKLFELANPTPLQFLHKLRTK